MEERKYKHQQAASGMQDTIQGSTEASRPRRGGERKDRTNEKRQEAEGVT
jgi:hypothetical protein